MNDLEKHVLQLIGEDENSPDVFTDDDTGLALIRGSINDAIQELCMLTGSYTKMYPIVLQANKQFYMIDPVSDYMGYIVDVWDRNRKKRLEAMSLNSMTMFNPRHMKENGDPAFYGYIVEKHIFISPYPLAEGIVLEAQIAMIPKPYTSDTDKIKVRVNFRNAAVYLAVSEYYASRGDANRAVDYLNRYLNVAGLMGLHPNTVEDIRQYQGFYRMRP